LLSCPEVGQMWTEWIESVCVLCAAAALTDMLMPEGRMHKAARTVAGLAFTACFVRLAAEGFAWLRG